MMPRLNHPAEGDPAVRGWLDECETVLARTPIYLNPTLYDACVEQGLISASDPLVVRLEKLVSTPRVPQT